MEGTNGFGAIISITEVRFDGYYVPSPSNPDGAAAVELVKRKVIPTVQTASSYTGGEQWDWQALTSRPYLPSSTWPGYLRRSQVGQSGTRRAAWIADLDGQIVTP